MNLDDVAESELFKKRIYGNPLIPFDPTPKQLAFMVSPQTETLMGGGAGSGKSLALLGAAAMYVQQPSYRAIIFRRTYPNLERTLIPDSQELWSQKADFNQNKKKWTFPSGATLEFGVLDHKSDKYDYQGAEYHFFGWDELSEFTEQTYKYLFSRTRRVKGDPIPLRWRATSNPVNNFRWIKARFGIEGKQSVVTEDRRYIHSDMTDNPHLDEDEYRQKLKNLTPVERKKLEEGDWSEMSGGNLFDRSDVQFEQSAPEMEQVVRFWDHAATEPKPSNRDPDYCASVKMGIDEYDEVWILDARRCRRNPSGTEKFIRQAAEEDGRQVPIKIEQEGGSQAKSAIQYYVKKTLREFEVYADTATRGKEERAGPLSSKWANGIVHVLRRDWTQPYIDHMHDQPDAPHDDWMDASSGAFNYLVENEGPKYCFG